MLQQLCTDFQWYVHTHFIKHMIETSMRKQYSAFTILMFQLLLNDQCGGQEQLWLQLRFCNHYVKIIS